MGNTTVKGLSESTGQSVENVIEMLSEAGIQVSTAEDELSQEQIMQFLDYKSKSAASSGRISLKAGAAKKTSASAGAKVAIKNRKKTLSLSSNASADTAPTSSDATSELTKQMESEARVRVEAEQQKREQEQAKQAAKQSAEQEAAAETAAPAESEASAAAETPAETPAPAPRVDLSPAEMAAQAKKEEGVGIKRRPSRKPTVTTTPSNDSVKVSKKGGKKVFEGRPQQENYGASGRRIKRKDKRKVNVEVSSDHQFEKPVAPVQKEITVPEMVVVSDLAKKLAVKGGDVLKAMMNMGMMATINQSIDQDTAILVVEEMGHKAEPEKTAAEEEDEAIALGDLEQFELKHRPPVVTIMGHVDHGKTSLLDYIRATRVAAGEAGGITQHIGAYHVETDDGIISFLDTPGHAAFSQMRSRGASSTDIVVIVVAADDGVMPQTIEAIKHTRAANVPLIVAVNKIDKEGADPERVKTAMTQHEVVPDDWGGEDVFVNLSAKTGEGVDSLLENILLIAEVQELKARDEGPAKGSIIESSIEKGRGAVATVLVQEGTLNKGDVVLAGNEYGKVRALLDENRKPTDSAGPSIPVEILGLSGTPSAGDELVVIESERLARELADKRKVSEREVEFTTQQAAKLEAMINKMSNADVQTINLMLKTDVHGSMEAIRTAIMDLSNAEIEVNIVLKGVGGISETDITLAQASQAVVLAFNVRADATARRLASESGVEIRYYSIIYELLDDIKDAMSGMLAPELREEMVGMAEVKAVYKGTGFGEIAGCMVTEGTVRRSLPIRVLRDNVVVYEGELESLRRFKDDVQEVKSGTECGIGVKDYDVRVGDQIEVFQRTEIERTMDDIKAED